MSEAQPVKLRKNANLVPCDTPSELRNWWFMEFPKDEMSYRAYKVKVLRFEKSGDGLLLHFELAGEAALARSSPPKPAPVDLYQATQLVWPELPSTVIHAKENQYAFLMLSDTWAESEDIDPALYAEGGGKWPFVAGELTSSAVQSKRSSK